MTCELYDRKLALYVEGDLPQQEAPRLEHHLQECPRCRKYRRSLEESQRELKALAAEPIDDTALAAVRERVLAVVTRPAASPRSMPTRGWALAAGLAVVALGLAFVWRTRPTAPRQAIGLASASPSPTPGPAQAEMQGSLVIGRVPVAPARLARSSREGVAAAASGRHSTARLDRAVSQSMEPETARVAPELSPDEADQLARAVVAVSRIRRLSDRASAAPAASSSPPLVRLETADPDVVIYWQLDSNGG
jgi:anti-sigma factor RsiW